MKTTKKLAGILLALVMVLAMAVPALAESGTAEDTKGTITISSPIKGQTYTIYKMFELESFNTEAPAYAYKITTDWDAFVTTGAGAAYFQKDAQGYVTLKTGVSIDNDSDTAAALAKAALSYADGKDLTGTSQTADDGDLVFSNLDLGYYLVDSSLGALCGLTTTKPGATVKEKNGEPTVTKQVQEDSKIPAPGAEDQSWGAENTAQIGQTVNFKTVVSAKKGAQNYVVHDVMSDGLALQEDTITVAGATKGDDYTVVTKITHYKKDDDGHDTTEVDYVCAFEITFVQAYLDDRTQNLDATTPSADFTITYSATLNEKAATGTTANTNETWLAYGDNSATEKAVTKTFTYEFDLVKTDSSNKVLEGAQFKLYDAETDGNEIQLVKNDDGTYRPAVTAEEKAAAVEIVAGQATIKGLDSDNYYLEETKQPAGYNKLTERVKVEINGANLEATVAGGVWTAGGVQVINKTGTELPSTGGIGTTIFYIVGGILLVLSLIHI